MNVSKEVRGEYVRLGPQRKVVLLVLGEACVLEEYLKEAPDILCRPLRRPNIRRAVGEAHADRLINVQPGLETVSRLKGGSMIDAMRTCSTPDSTSWGST